MAETSMSWMMILGGAAVLGVGLLVVVVTITAIASRGRH